jgi:hypothetical protein
LSSRMIHHANHLRENLDGLKVGGHQSSSASLVTIMTALYFAVLRPQDRVAVKPHASPVFHAIQYLLGKQSRGKLENFRAYTGRAELSYPRARRRAFRSGTHDCRPLPSLRNRYRRDHRSDRSMRPARPICFRTPLRTAMSA